MIRSYAVAIASLLAGASVVHNIYKPDLTIPGAVSGGEKAENAEIQKARGGEERAPGITEVNANSAPKAPEEKQ
ncbi:unnamed protein product [Closterium sp. Naga37s-1]|nr:unnamed protein product [Closterium sp. Naga37s-1]